MLTAGVMMMMNSCQWYLIRYRCSSSQLTDRKLLLTRIWTLTLTWRNLQFLRPLACSALSSNVLTCSLITSSLNTFLHGDAVPVILPQCSATSKNKRWQSAPAIQELSLLFSHLFSEAHSWANINEWNSISRNQPTQWCNLLYWQKMGLNMF